MYLSRSCPLILDLLRGKTAPIKILQTRNPGIVIHDSREDFRIAEDYRERLLTLGKSFSRDKTLVVLQFSRSSFFFFSFFLQGRG